MSEDQRSHCKSSQNPESQAITGYHRSVPGGHVQLPAVGSVGFERAGPGRWWLSISIGCSTEVGGLRKPTKEGSYNCLQLPPKKNAFPLLLIKISDLCFSLAECNFKIYWENIGGNIVPASPL